MNDNKQIEEMAKVIQSVAEKRHGIWCKELAKIIYNAGYRKQEWISVDERLPEDGGMYLIYNPSRMVSKVVTARYSKDSNRWCSADACCYHEGITHWMPLPEPPKGGAE